jgi:hypothetical protein
MNKLLPSFFLLGILTWNACGCPPDEQTGELALSTEAKDFLAYDGSETLTFVNENGESLNFTAIRGREFTQDQVCYRTTCTEAKFNSPSSCEYYAIESERFSFFSEDNTVVLDLLLYSEVYDYGLADFYDAFQLAFSFGTPSISGRHVIGPRFVGDFDVNDLDLMDLFSEEASLELNGQTYTDLLVYTEGNLAVYVEPGRGLVGFKNATNTWIIQ